MTTRVRVTAYCLDWHVNYSAAFRELLVVPLEKYADVTLVPWDGTNLPDATHVDDDLPAIFCQLAPPAGYFERVDPARVVWIPMWDNIREYDQGWWNALPPQLRIVGFSRAVVARAEHARLPVLSLRYFLDPREYAPATWPDGITLFYWNRVGLVGPKFLRELCSALDARTLLFRPDLDPHIDHSLGYELPGHLGGTSVHVISPLDRESHLAHLRSANVFLAPRPYEGVGLSFVEALASGCAVLAHNGPSMSEYISHAENGFLFQHSHGQAGTHRRLLGRVGLCGPRDEVPFILPLDQNWRTLKRLDLRAVGTRARESQAQGFLRWHGSWAEYARFVLGRPR